VRRVIVVPIYEYECEKCQHRFEILQKFNERPLKKCTKCGGPVHKVLSPPGLLFKGSGWYVTDYASAERKKAMKAEKGSDASNGDKKTGAAESKTTPPATKKDD
jgi:putative FmdB family regulatory protein